MDLLDQEQEEYYFLDAITAKLVDAAVGREAFDRYEGLIEMGLYMDPNVPGELTVENVIKKIEGILDLDDANFQTHTEYGTESDKMTSFWTVIAPLAGTVIGAAASLLGVWYNHKREEQRREKYSAAILRNDLKSIERYLSHEKNAVNIRYSDNWQSSVAGCPFLTEEHVAWLYKFYDEAYNYNYIYKVKEEQGTSFQKEDIPSYGEMQRAMFETRKGQPDFEQLNAKYQDLIEQLEGVIK